MQFHQCRPEDLDSINALIEAWYGPDRRYSTGLFNWAFFERVPEPSLLMGLKDGEKLIGTQAVMPVPLRRGAQIIGSAKSEETLLHTDYRGQGLFYKIYEEIFDHVDPRIDVIWGTTSAARPFVKCGFSTPATLCYTIAFTGPPSAKFPIGEAVAATTKQKLKRKAFKFLHWFLSKKTGRMVKKTGYDKRVEKGLDLVFYEAIWEKMTYQYPSLLSVERSREWLRWRLERNPSRKYRMLRFIENDARGALLYTVNEETNTVFLVDFVAYGLVPIAANALVKTLVQTAWRNKRSCIIDQALNVKLPPQQARIDALLRFGSIFYPMENVSFVRRISPRLSANDPRFDADNWYYTYLMTHGNRV
jgi:hypothetical protein